MASGVAGAALTGLALLLRRRSPQEEWGWFALFGAGVAAAEWFELFTLQDANVAIVQVGRSVLMTAAFLALGEFARRGCRRIRGRGPERWKLLLLLALGGSGAWLAPAEFDVMLRYAFVLLVCLGTAWVLRAMVIGKPHALRHGLTLAAYSLLIFGVVNLLVPKAPFFPASVLHINLWLAAAVTVKMFHVLLLWLMAFGVWLYLRRGRPAPTMDGVGWGWFAPAIILLVLVLGWGATEWRGRNIATVMSSQLQLQATQIARALNPELCRRLPFAETDRTNITYACIRGQMIAYGKAIKHRSIYSVALRDGQLKFGPENLAVDDTFASVPGTVYHEPPKGLRELFASPDSLVVGPYQDEYGTFVSGFAPVLDPHDGSVLLIVGLDLVADDWQKNIAAHRLQPIILSLVLLLVVTLGLAVLELANQPRTEQTRHLVSIEALMVGLTGLTFSAIVGLIVYDVEISDRWVAFEQLASTHAEEVRAAAGEFQQDLIDFAPALQSFSLLGESEFRAISKTIASKGSVRSVQWIARGNSGNLVTRFVEPKAGNEQLLDLGVNANPVLETAVEKALRTRLPTATPPMPLAANARNFVGVVLFCPVFAKDPDQLLGLVASTIDIKSLLQLDIAHFNTEESDMTITVVDFDAQGGAKMIAQYPPNEKMPNLSKLDLFRSNRNSLSELFPMFMYDRACGIVTDPGANFGGAHPRRFAVISFGGGCLMTATITLFVIFIRRRQGELESKVQERTHALREAKDAAETADRAKSEFLATISHEIRTPMTGILGTTELLQRTRIDAHQRELLENNARSGYALLATINDILDFSKIEARQLELVESDFAIRPLVNEVVESTIQTNLAKPVKVSAVWSDDLPAMLRGDAVRLRQLLVNLVGNAFKFTHSGTVMVRVTNGEPKDGRVRIRFEVADTGIGINEAKQKLLFQPFQQMDTSDSRRFSGTGLGLAICRRLVELMGGKIGVNSREGAGSTFWFELDLAVAAEVSLAKLRVLVAEDHPLNQRLALLSLSKLGCKSAAVSSGKELLTRVQPGGWDILLLSRQLSDMSLEKVLRELDASGAKISMVGLAIADSPVEADAFHAAGVKVCLAKPFTIWQLRDALIEAHGLGKASREKA